MKIRGKTAIVILNYKSYELTIRLVKLIKTGSVLSKDDEIIVIDNNSPNESGTKLQEVANALGFILLISESNKGYSAGNNIGLKYAYFNGFEYALILNNDIEFHSDQTILIDTLTKMFEQSDIAIVSPIILSNEKKIVPHFTRYPTFFNLSLLYPFYRILDYFSKGKDETQKLYKPSGCCMMVRLDHMNKIDYLDEKTFLYSEEDILAEKLRALKLSIYSCKEVKVIHNHSKTVKTSFNKKHIMNMKITSYEYYLSNYLNYSPIKIRIVSMMKKILLILKG